MTRVVDVLSRLTRSGPAWAVVCALVLLPQAWFMVKLSYPGRANVDIAFQLRQARGEIPYTDWHPPVMSALWELLIGLTGQVGSLFLLQTAALVSAVWLLAMAVHRRTGERRWTWWVLLLPLTPWTLGQTAVLFKDTQMAVALLAAAALLLLVEPRRRATLWLVLPALVLLVYATSVRKNAVFAIVALAVWVGWLGLQALRLRGVFRGRAVLAAGLVVMAVVGLGSSLLDRSIASVKSVEATGSVTQIMLDDVMFSVPPGELRATGAPPELVERIDSSRAKCYELGEIWDSYFNCYGRGAGGAMFSPLEQQDEIRRLWREHVITHPLRYLTYRSAVFGYYFFSSSLEWWPYEWRGEAESVGLGPQSRNTDYLARYYVQEFAATTFPWLFKPWFWTAVAIVCVALSRRAGVLQPAVLALAWSALGYVAGYLPVVPANHFRYTFWPALALTLAVGLLLAGRSHSRAGTAEATERP